MSEAEVSLRLAFYLIRNDMVTSDVKVAIDGAQIKTKDKIHFPLNEFLEQNNCLRFRLSHGWSGTYNLGARYNLVIHSRPGKGDVVAKTRSGNTIWIESKKGPLQRSKSSAEYRLIREALGQLLTIEKLGIRDILAVAVPKSEKIESLAIAWRKAPLIKKLGIKILTVSRDGNVAGL